MKAPLLKDMQQDLTEARRQIAESKEALANATEEARYAHSIFAVNASSASPFIH